MTSTKKIAVVTGANSGLGRITSLRLAESGYHVVMACRNLDRTLPVMDEIRLGGGSVAFVHLDLASLSSVRSAAEQILASCPRIDLLVNNAGLAGHRGVTEDGFELAFGVNYLGHFLLTNLLLDRIKESDKSRIVNVSSGSHADTRVLELDRKRQRTQSLTGLPEYNQSKLCNVLFTLEMRKRLLGTDVICVSLDPGSTSTGVWRAIPRPVRTIMKWFMARDTEGAQTILYCSLSEDLIAFNSHYYASSAVKRASPLGRRNVVASLLWERSMDWTALNK